MNEYPVQSPDALNKAILSQLKVALSDLRCQGVSLPARVTMTNVNINTNLVTRGVATATPKNDASLFGRVQRGPTTPGPTAQVFRSGFSQQTSAHGFPYPYDLYQSGFEHPISPKYIFGHPSFRSDPFSFVPTDPHQQAPTWPI